MRTLAPAERWALRAKAHHLHPVVSVGNNGLTASVLHEIDVNLTAHELVKVRVFEGDRAERERLFAQACSALGAAPVQHLGKILTLWRPAPAPEAMMAPTKAGSAGPSTSRRRAAPRQLQPECNPRRRRLQA